MQLMVMLAMPLIFIDCCWRATHSGMCPRMLTALICMRTSYLCDCRHIQMVSCTGVWGNQVARGFEKPVVPETTESLPCVPSEPTRYCDAQTLKSAVVIHNSNTVTCSAEYTGAHILCDTMQQPHDLSLVHGMHAGSLQAPLRYTYNH